MKMVTMNCVTLVFVLFLLNFCFFCRAIRVGDLDIPLGMEQGINTTASVSMDTLQRVLAGVEKGNKENIYFYGLLKLYGISVVKDISGAAQQFQRASGLGHKEATTAYGVMMLSGATGKKDYSEALRYFRDGVNQGDDNSYWLLGLMLMEGKGIGRPQYAEAAAYLQVAAENNVPQALHCMGLLHEYGNGLSQDFDKAASYYKRAMELQHPESMYNLAMMYAYGRGFPQDYTHARSLLEKAAIYEHAPSLYYVGIFKTYGYGCNVNYEQAIRWFERAIAADDDRVAEKARKAAQELKQVLEGAYRANQEMFTNYQQRVMLANKPGKDD